MTSGPALLLGALLAAAPPTTPPAGAAATPPAGKASPERPAPAGKGPAKRPALAAVSLPTLEGEVTAIDHHAHQLRVRTPSGEVTLSFDRDTFVRDAGGAATPLQILPGSRVKVGKDGEARAAWVEISAATSTPGPTP